MVRTRKSERMVKFKNLYSDPENRPILNVIDSPTGKITVFEPSKDDVAKIIQMDGMIASFNQEPSEDNMLQVDGPEILKKLIPMLTDIEIDPDMTDEEMNEVIENPTVELMQVNAILESVVTHIYQLMILSFKTELDLQRMVGASYESADKAVGMLLDSASKSAEGRQLLDEINKTSKEAKETEEKAKDSLAEKVAAAQAALAAKEDAEKAEEKPVQE